MNIKLTDGLNGLYIKAKICDTGYSKVEGKIHHTIVGRYYTVKSIDGDSIIILNYSNDEFLYGINTFEILSLTSEPEIDVDLGITFNANELQIICTVLNLIYASKSVPHGSEIDVIQDMLYNVDSISTNDTIAIKNMIDRLQST